MVLAQRHLDADLDRGARQPAFPERVEPPTGDGRHRFMGRRGILGACAGAAPGTCPALSLEELGAGVDDRRVMAGCRDMPFQPNREASGRSIFISIRRPGI